MSDSSNIFVMSMGKAANCVDLRKLGMVDGDEEWALARGETKALEPILFEVIQGSVLPDVMWNGFYPIVSDRLAGLIELEGITGCRLYPCIVKTLQPSNAKYFVMGITGRCREITFAVEKSANLRMKLDKKGRRLLYSVLDVDLTEWDGTDLFMGRSKRTAHRCVSDKFRSICKKHKITGICFNLPDEHEMFVDIA